MSLADIRIFLLRPRTIYLRTRIAKWLVRSAYKSMCMDFERQTGSHRDDCPFTFIDFLTERHTGFFNEGEWNEIGNLWSWSQGR